MKKSAIVISVVTISVVAVYVVWTWGPRRSAQGPRERTGDVLVGSSEVPQEAVGTVLGRDKRPVGRVTVTVVGAEPLQAQLTRAVVMDETEPNTRIEVAGPQWLLPAGRFRLAEGRVSYGVQDGNEWTANFCAGFAFTVDGDRSTPIELGRPTLSLGVCDSDGPRNSAQEKPVFARGAKLWLTPRIQGRGGEIYSGFWRREAASGRMVPVKQHVAVLGSGDKPLWSEDIHWGAG